MAFELPGFQTVLDWFIVTFIVGTSSWNAFIEYGKAAGETPDEPEESTDGGTAELQNTAVPDDRHTRGLASTGTEIPYRRVVKGHLFRLGLLAFAPALFLVRYRNVIAIEPVVPLGTAGEVAVGIGLGAGVFFGNRGLFRWLKRRGLAHSSGALTRQLSPEGPAQSVVHFTVLLPAVAVAEELWYRGALVAVVNAAAGIPFWLLIPFSAVLFGMPHREQGRTAVLLLTLGGVAFALGLVPTGSLLVPIVAHYLMNALTFGYVRYHGEN